RVRRHPARIERRGQDHDAADDLRAVVSQRREHPLRRSRHYACELGADRRVGRRARPRGAPAVAADERARKSRAGRLFAPAESSWDREPGARLCAVPALERTPAAGSWNPVRRGAPDVRTGARTDGLAAPADARRAEPWPGAETGGGDVRDAAEP